MPVRAVERELVDRRATTQRDQRPVGIAPEDRGIGPAGADLGIRGHEECVVQADVNVESLHEEAELLHSPTICGLDRAQQTPAAVRPALEVEGNDGDALEELPLADESGEEPGGWVGATARHDRVRERAVAQWRRPPRDRPRRR